MNRKQTWYEKVSDFISGKGFYLVVLICVAAIALSGFYLMQGIGGVMDGGETDLPVSGSAAIAEPPSALPSFSVQSPPPAATTQPSARPTQKPVPSFSPAPSDAPSNHSPEPEETPAALVFTWPVKGSVLASFSIEALAYDETMGDWRIHDGLDISSALGTQVLATANGTVSAAYEDDLMGTTDVVDHGNGLTSLYANLEEVPTVAVGDSVTTGAILGSVGDTAAVESGRAPHLHFAMYQDDLPIDPTALLP